MPTFRANAHSRGFSLVEMLCVAAIIAILAALLLPGLVKVRDRARQAQCVGQLKDIGVAFHSFAHDHNSQFPMSVPALAGGSLEFTRQASQPGSNAFFAYRHFQPLANELVTPKLLVCPTDALRVPALRFADLNNQHLSFFVGLNAEFGKPGSVLAGDRNLTNDWTPSGGIQRLAPTQVLRWSHELHRFRGNLLFADAHVEQSSSSGLMTLAQSAGGRVFVLNLPAVPTASARPPATGAASPGSTASAGTTAGNGPAPGDQTRSRDAAQASPERAEPPSSRGEVPLEGKSPTAITALGVPSTPIIGERAAPTPISQAGSAPAPANAVTNSNASASSGNAGSGTADVTGAHRVPFLGFDIPVNFLWAFYLGLVLLALLAALLKRRLAASAEDHPPHKKS